MGKTTIKQETHFRSKLIALSISLMMCLAISNVLDFTVHASSSKQEIVFIENNLDDYQILVDGVKSGLEVHVLDARQDGLAQMAQIVAGRNGIDAIHIVSHGAEGSLGLGTLTLTSQNLEDHAGDLAVIGGVLRSDADILLYGCDVAKGPGGAAFVTALAQATQADVAASTNATGSMRLGGDWILELETGEISVPSISFGSEFNGLLPSSMVVPPAGGIYVRPGGISYTWSYGNGTTPDPVYPGSYPVSEISYYNVDFPPSGVSSSDYILTRGKFQYSTDGGNNWTDYNVSYTSTFVSVSGKLWRFVDNKPADSTTTNSVGTGWKLSGVPNPIGSGSTVIPDNPPTEIASSKDYFLSGSSQGSSVATLTPTDTGYTTMGYWAIDNQSVPNLFKISFDRFSGNTASLILDSGTVPAIGQTATVTVRYYDLYQTDSSGNPINGQGFSKQLTFTVVADQSQDLNFGNDLKISAFADNDQTSPSVATLSNGNFVTIWQSAGQDGENASSNGIYGRIYTSSGIAVGSEFAISEAGNNINEITPVVSALNNGRFVVAYATTPGADGLDIAYRIVEANGTVGSQLIANTTVEGDQASPSITTLSDGSFVIVWATDGTIQGQKFNAVNGSKNGSELTIDSAASDVSPSIAALSNGAYAVVWGDGSTSNINAVVSTAPSTVISVTDDGASWSYDTYTPLPRVVGLTGGGFVVAWDSYVNDMVDYLRSDIFFQQYNNAGVAQSSITQANATAMGYKFEATVAALSGGGFVIGWQSDTGDYDLNGIFGRRFNSTGDAVDAGDFEINQYRRGDQNSPAIAALSSDTFATVWVDDTSDTTSAGIEGRVLLSDNTTPTFVGATTALNVNMNAPATDIKSLLHVSDSDSSQTLTWTQSSAPSHGTLSISSATASSGSTDVTPGGSITYTPTVGYLGVDSFIVQVSDGTATATRTISVTVSDITAPILSGTGSSNITTNAATVSATSDETATMYYVITTSSTTPSAAQVMAGQDQFGSAAVKSGNGAATANVAKDFNVSGLTAGTSYYVYFVSKDSSANSSSVGNASFSTTAAVSAPTVTTGAVSGITITGALLNAVVNDNGAVTTVSFDYGTTATYGTNIAATTGSTVAAGAGSTSASVTLTGLAPNTTYHYRVKGVNSAGTTNGSDQTFTTAALPVLGGTAAISGTAKYGQTLTANLSGVTYTPTVAGDVPTYQWKRGGADIGGATSASYVLTQTDIGAVITVTVTADGTHATGSVTSAGTAAVAKADGPAAPTVPVLDTKTTASINLQAVAGQEYSSDNGTTWQDSVTFSGLTPDTDYTIKTRVKATATQEASAASAGTTIRTAALPVLGGTAAISGTVKYGQTLTANLSGVTYTPTVAGDVPTYQWKRGGADIGGATSASYVLTQTDIGAVITVTVTADGTHATGSVTSAGTAAVAKADGPAAPTVPVLDTKTTASINLQAVAGQEYSSDNGTTWQDSVTFSGLTPDTDYTIKTRVKATATQEASAASAGTTIRTAALPVLGGTAAISGTVKYGQTLTANLSGVTYTPTVAGDLPTYQWKRGGADIGGATSASYVLTQTDIGAVITVTVTADGTHATGSVTSAGTAAVAKADGPAAPTVPVLDTKTTASINLQAVAGQEYSSDNGTTWQDSVTFSGLTPDTDYTIKTRVKATATQEASAASAGTTIRTDVGLTYNIAAISNKSATALTQGYAAATQGTETIQVTNAGTGNLMNLTAALSGTNANDFVITQPTATLNSAAETSFTVTAKDGLVAGTYTATVTVSATNMSDVMFTVTQVVNLPNVSANPQNVAATAGVRQVTLDWSTVTEATYYNVYMSTVSGLYSNDPVDTVTATTYNFQNLINGTTYYFIVKAGNFGGLSAASNQADATPATVPDAPTNVSAVAGDGLATISFTAPIDNGGSAITGYEVTVFPGNLVKTGTLSPITITGLSNGTSYTFKVKTINHVGNSDSSLESNAVVPMSSGSDSTPPSDSTSSDNDNIGMDVLVNGKVENLGTGTKSRRTEQTVITVNIDQKKLEDKLASAGLRAVVTVPVNTQSDIVSVELTGDMIKHMEDKLAVLEIKTDRGTYTLPAQQINMDFIVSQLGKSVDLQKIKLQIEMAVSAADKMKVVDNAANNGSFSIVALPIDFTIRASYGDTTIEVSKFNTYVERTIALPDGVDPNRITTGVVVEPNGTVRHVPTHVIKSDDRYFAKVNSLTNSTYSIVWHPLEFSDVANHWAKDAVNNMGSRMVINGVGNDQFSPDQDISRAEFAAIIVRGLGLKLENGATPFSDVKTTDWYNSVINTAHMYQLVNGFEDGTFRPNDKITREQAMAIIAKAMTITNLKAKLPIQSNNETLHPFADADKASAWAQSSVADSVQAGIVSGRSSTELAPKDNITRAEVAMIMERLLKKSDLI